MWCYVYVYILFIMNIYVESNELNVKIVKSSIFP